MRFKVILKAICLLSLVFGSVWNSAAAGPVSIVSNGNVTGASVRQGWNPVQSNFVSNFDQMDEVQKSVETGALVSEVEFLWSNEKENLTEFFMDFSLEHNSDNGSYSRSSTEMMKISMSDDAFFSIEGDFISFGLGKAFFTATIVDAKTGKKIYHSRNTSESLQKNLSLDQSFNGKKILSAGQDYLVYFSAISIANGSLESASWASGGASISFWNVSEPASVALILYFVLFISAISIKRRAQGVN
ncbi:MAG: hypothetical protein AAFV59_11355 [Pseudomonadota bacterium]